jgi:hypothetical protein
MIAVLTGLQEQLASIPRRGGSYYVRHLDKNEPIPQFGHGLLESPLVNKEWIWVAYSLSSSKPLAILSAAPVHNFALLYRIYAINGTPILGLLRKSLEDISLRGYTSYGVFLDSKQKECQKLLRIVKKAGGRVAADGHYLAYGPTQIRW